MNPQSRRQFLTTVAAGGASGWLAVHRSHGDTPPNDDIRVAVVGLRGRGKSHVGGFGSHVTAVCDVDQGVLEDRAAWTEDKVGHPVQRFVDFRRMLDEADIDAVSIATPNHTHALIAIAAIQAGKHVYCEKPVSHNVWEGRQIVNAARRYDRLVQCGTQSRSSQGIRDAVAYVQAGNLGAIQYVLGTCYKARPSIGKLNQALKIPSSIDYDVWCGPAEKVDLYRPQLHYDWHWDFNTGNGDMGNQGIHQMDIARWFLGEQTLSPRILSLGGRVGYEDAGDTPNTQVVIHDYPTAPLIFETRGMPRSKADHATWDNAHMDQHRGSQIGVIVQCERGHVLVSSYLGAVAMDRDGVEIKRWMGSEDHFENFLQAVTDGDRAQLNAEIEEGHLSSALCHTGNISHQLGTPMPIEALQEMVAEHELLSDSLSRTRDHLRRNGLNEVSLTAGPWLTMDPVTEQFIGNDEANRRLTREYRRPFVITPEPASRVS